MSARDRRQSDRRHLLQARAEALARVPVRDDSSADPIEILEFQLARERYAIETCHVREVTPLERLTPVPCTPPFVLGVINLRGQIISVIDLKTFFELPGKGLTDLNKVLVLEQGEMRFGILADAIVGVRRLPRSNLQASLPTLTGVREQYLRGVTADRLVVLDANRLLGDRRVVVDEEVAA